MPHNEKPSQPNENGRGLSAAAIIASGVVVLGAAGTGAYAAAGGFDPSFPRPTTWAAVATWHIPPAPGADSIIKRELGASAGNTTDDTQRMTFTDEYGDQVTSNSSPWERIDARQFGVPASSTAVRLQFKAVITGIAGTESTVYAFVKTDGSPLCPGPPGFKRYPVDFVWTGEVAHGGEKCWAIHGTADGANGVRDFNTVDVPLTHGKFDFAWGYRKPPGQYPHGSAVAVGVWLDGWARG